jgi:catechol 2,3-dioxygenase-like lactoylglutathione lyase family enzyme
VTIWTRSNAVPEPLRSIHHVGIVVRDLDASIAWYVEHLGFERSYGYNFPGVKAAFIRRGDLRLEFFESDGARPMAAERERPETNLTLGGINHFAIAVDDLDDAVSDLGARGVEIASCPMDVPESGGERYAFIRDNERMLIELFQPIQQRSGTADD